jgi:signal transduction histidine kinase
VDALRDEAEAKGVDLRVTIGAAPLHVLGDAARLEQIALNLIANAIKFTPSTGRVEVSLGRRAGCAVLTVRDTGCGITPELLTHVFDRFRQGAANGRKHGLGLGLAIVRYLVEAHDGTVRAESPGPGEGAIFTVELPLHNAVLASPSAR